MAGEWKQLLNDANLAPEARTKLEAAIAEIDALAGTVLDNGVKRQADYSRHMNELQEKSRTYDANAAALAEQYNQMVSYADAVEAERDAAQAALRAKQGEPTVTPNPNPAPVVGAAPGSTPTPAPVVPAGMTKEEIATMLDERARQLAAGAQGYYGEIFEIQHQHQQLFGKPINGKELMKAATMAKQTPEEYWKATYKPDEKREELAKKADDERITKIREEERQKVLSELSNPATKPLADSQNPFYVPAGSATEVDPFSDTETDGDRAMLDALTRIA